MKMAHKGTEVVYIPGNHDAGFRKLIGAEFGNIRIDDNVIHECVNGERLLVVHGDAFDAVIQKYLWLAHIGSWLYDMLLMLSTRVHQLRRAAGRVHWSLSAYLKRKVKSAVQYVGRYEEAVVAEARRLEVDGVVCGHIHHAVITDFEGVKYMNCGDWVESMTAIVEHMDGNFELIQWSKRCQ
jgi:UDP-2,3-diacylglucosamine pyrophosphatase LpxH